MKEIIKTIGDQTVESSLGWNINILSLESFEYREDEKTITLEIEDRPDARGEMEWIIYSPENWRWKNEEPIAGVKIPGILNRIRLAFWKLDMKIKEIV